MKYGTVKWYSEGQGRGLIFPDGGGRDLPVSHSDIEGEGFKVLYEGQHVSFETGENGKGPSAKRVKPREEG
jgi:cold shock protein